MYIQNCTSKRNGKSYTYPLLCKKYREGGKIKTEVILNLSKVSKEIVLSIENALKKDVQVSINDISVTKSVDYGFVSVILSLLKELRIDETLEKTIPSASAKIVQLLIIGKIVTRGSKLCIFNWINQNPEIAQKLGVDLSGLKINDFYETLEDFSNLQNRIEKKWNVYHKASDEVFLYDITSSYFEGVKNKLSEYGYNRDGKKGKKQIVIGLITTSSGFPLSIEVFNGNLNDHLTVKGQLEKIKTNFGVNNIVFIGDRGMKIRYNLNLMDTKEQEGIEYITGLGIDEIKGLIQKDVIQLSLFSKDIAEIETPENTRYILCSNPILEDQQSTIRLIMKNKLLQKIEVLESSFNKAKQKHISNKLRIENGDKNKKLVCKFTQKQIDNYKYKTRNLVEKYNMQAFFKVEISDTVFNIVFDQNNYSQAGQLDGKYVFVTNVPKNKMDKEMIRKQYKKLQHVEHAFRDMKTVKLNIRPIFHVKESTTRGHVFTSMFSYAIIREMEDRISPWLKIYNKENKTQLAFNDIVGELKKIKETELQLGKNYNHIQITKLSKIQNEIVKALNVKIA